PLVLSGMRLPAPVQQGTEYVRGPRLVELATATSPFLAGVANAERVPPGAASGSTPASIAARPVVAVVHDRAVPLSLLQRHRSWLAVLRRARLPAPGYAGTPPPPRF